MAGRTRCLFSYLSPIVPALGALARDRGRMDPLILGQDEEIKWINKINTSEQKYKYKYKYIYIYIYT